MSTHISYPFHTLSRTRVSFWDSHFLVRKTIKEFHMKYNNYTVKQYAAMYELCHSSIFRKGKVGDWMNYLIVPQMAEPGKTLIQEKFGQYDLIIDAYNVAEIEVLLMPQEVKLDKVTKEIDIAKVEANLAHTKNQTSRRPKTTMPDVSQAWPYCAPIFLL
ncbi:hypothetical protein G4B88_014990, partial [Cannabis sativa]